MSESTTERGHLFVIDGDLTKIACDAWLLPTDDDFDITPTWQHVLRPEDLIAQNSPGSSRVLRPESIIPGDQEWVWQYRTTSVDSPEIFLARIGHKGEQGIKHACRNFLRMARPNALNRARQENRRPLLALNAVATGQGGMKQRRSVAIRTLIKEIYTLLESDFNDVDVILVCWGPIAESAAQSIRLGIAGGDPSSDPRWQFPDTVHHRLHEVAKTLSSNLRRGEVSVFMGAGVSAGAGLRDWNGLLEEIGKRTNPPTTRDELMSVHDNRDAAELLSRRLHRNGLSLETELKAGLSGQQFSLQHGLLASLPCSEYITTNVDSLFEIAARQKDSPVLKEMPSSEGIRSGDRWLLKLHGSVNRAGSLVFTREHYIDSFKSNRALVGLVQSMLLTRHMLFVGYGLRDEDFHELVHEVNAARSSNPERSSMGTVLSLFDDPVRSDLWAGTVEMVSMRPYNEKPTQADTQSAARDIERFLDLLGMLSVDDTRFVLDPSYADELPEDVTFLKEHVDPLVTALKDGKVDQSSPTWRRVREVLKMLGAELD